VDFVDEDGAFRGGSIFPGLRLMAQALCDHTAALPFVDVTQPRPFLPGLDTRQAIRAGVYYAVAGGINTLINLLSAEARGPVQVFLTGGDATLLAPVLHSHAEHWPEMTLEGIRLSALHQCPKQE
jgi:type III pantothenate kinase